MGFHDSPPLPYDVRLISKKWTWKKWTVILLFSLILKDPEGADLAEWVSRQEKTTPEYDNGLEVKTGNECSNRFS